MTNGMAVQLLIGMVIKRGSGQTAGLLKWSNATAGKAGRGRWGSGGAAAERFDAPARARAGAGAGRSNEGVVKRDGQTRVWSNARWSSGMMAMARGDGVA